MATLYKASGEIVNNVFPTNKKSFSLKELYLLVNCETIDIISLHDGKLMVIDDNGKFDEHVKNEKATELFLKGRMNSKEVKEYHNKLKTLGFEVIVIDEGRLDGEDYIAGDALVCETFEIR